MLELILIRRHKSVRIHREWIVSSIIFWCDISVVKMLPIRVFLYFILFISLVCAINEQQNQNIACRSVTCRDCVRRKLDNCVWKIYFSGAEQCTSKMGHNEDVRAEADEPAKCAKPDCVVARHEPWDLEGIAQLVGGLFGGFIGGCLAILGYKRVREGGNRLGYQQIGGGESWRDVLRAFFRAFLDRIRRRNVNQVDAEDDPAAERQLRAGIHRELRERNRQRQQQAREGNPGINQAGMGMQFAGQEVVGNDANIISPNRPGSSGGAVTTRQQNLTPGGNAGDLDSDDFDDAGGD